MSREKSIKCKHCGSTVAESYFDEHLRVSCNRQQTKSGVTNKKGSKKVIRRLQAQLLNNKIQRLLHQAWEGDLSAVSELKAMMADKKLTHKIRWIADGEKNRGAGFRSIVDLTGVIAPESPKKIKKKSNYPRKGKLLPKPSGKNPDWEKCRRGKDVFVSGKVVSGGGFGLGKSRKH